MSEELKLGKIPLEHAALWMCDLQEKFRPAMLHFAEVIVNAKKLVDCGKILGVPLVVTEQYPKGLGSTVSEIDVQHAVCKVAKTKFSMVVPEVESVMKELCSGQLKCAILFGVEAHVCVEQTAMDLISKGIKVHVVADATTSRTQEDRMLAFDRLRQIGCFVTTSENVIYKLLGDKDHPKFNDVRPIIKDTTLETGLVSKMNDVGLSKMPWRMKIELAHTVLTRLVSDGRINRKIVTDLEKELMALKSQHTWELAETAKEGERSIRLTRSREKKCGTCGKEFSRPQDLRRHLATHQPVSSFLCDECGKSYRSPDGLKYHKEATHPPNISTGSAVESGVYHFSCEECDKSFSGPNQLKAHIKNTHRRKKSVFTCELCRPPATFQRRDVFKAHRIALHSQAPKPYVCLVCDKRFSTRSNLRSHNRTHDPSSAYMCLSCSRRFNSKTKLDTHSTQCLSLKSCPFCKFAGLSEEELLRHTRSVHPADYALHHVFGDNLDGLVV